MLSVEGAGLLTGLVLEEDPAVLALALPPPDSPQHSEAFDPLAIRTGRTTDHTPPKHRAGEGGLVVDQGGKGLIKSYSGLWSYAVSTVSGLLSIAKSRGVGDEPSVSSPHPVDTPPTQTTASEPRKLSTHTFIHVRAQNLM